MFTFTNMFNGTAPVGNGGPVGTGGPTGVGPPTGVGAGPLALLLFMYNICGTGAPFIVVLLVLLLVVFVLVVLVVLFVLLSVGLDDLGLVGAGLAVLLLLLLFTGVLDLLPEAAVSLDLDSLELSTVVLDTFSAPAAVDGGFDAVPSPSATPLVRPPELLDEV